MLPGKVTLLAWGSLRAAGSQPSALWPWSWGLGSASSPLVVRRLGLHPLSFRQRQPAKLRPVNVQASWLYVPIRDTPSPSPPGPFRRVTPPAQASALGVRGLPRTSGCAGLSWEALCIYKSHPLTAVGWQHERLDLRRDLEPMRSPSRVSAGRRADSALPGPALAGGLGGVPLGKCPFDLWAQSGYGYAPCISRQGWSRWGCGGTPVSLCQEFLATWTP